MLAQLLTDITRHPRQKVILGKDFTWSSSWTYNLFRIFELVFWRRCGIRIEMSCNSDGVVQYHTFESFIVHMEAILRSFRFPRIVQVYVPQFSSPVGLPMPSSPYLFAVAFDTSALSIEANNTGQSWTHTVTGSNPILVVFDEAESSTVDPYSNMTVAGTSITVAASKASSNRFCKAWYQNNPTTGSSLTIQPTLTSQFNQGASSSFSGVVQSGIDNTATNSGSSTTQSATITPVAGSSWGIIGTISDGGGTATVIAGTTQRQAGSAPLLWGDSNGTISGATQLGWTTSLSSNWAAIAITIAPAGGAATTSVNHFLGLLGIGT